MQEFLAPLPFEPAPAVPCAAMKTDDPWNDAANTVGAIVFALAALGVLLLVGDALIAWVT